MKVFTETQAMSNYDLIAFDMDGTLLNSEKQISEENIAAIEKAYRSGRHIALSTGRCIEELKPYFDRIPGVRYLITVSGALVFDLAEDKCIYESPLPPRITAEILNIAKEHDQLTQLMSMHNFLQQDKFDSVESYNMGVYRELYRSTADIVPDLFEYYSLNTPPVYKLNLFMKNTQDRTSMFERLRHLELETIFSEVTGLEYNNPGVSKGAGLRALCDHLGVPVSRSIAVGDADNDLEIIRTAGLGIAMGNANENIRAAADVIVSDCDHSGCAEAIYKYLL